MAPSPLTPLLARLVKTTRRLEDGLRSAVLLRDELVLALVPENEWSRLSGLIYDGEDRFHAEAARGLYDWEERLLAAHFPKAPARLLIGGAGSGREARELAAKGHFVALLEPAQALLAEARESVPQARLLAAVAADYEALALGRSGLEAGAPYDAVILGWDSLSYLPPHKALPLFCALKRLAPSGPLLASTIHFPRVGPKRLTLRRFFGKLGLRRAAEGELFLPHLGTMHLYTAEELAALAEQSGYLIVESEQDPLSVTWTALWRPKQLSSDLDTLPTA